MESGRCKVWSGHELNGHGASRLRKTRSDILQLEREKRLMVLISFQDCLGIDRTGSRMP